MQHPEHMNDLIKSGLMPATIEQAHIETVLPVDITRELGFTVQGLLSLYRIPYPGTEFCRYKAFYEPGSNGDHPKYLQKMGSGNRLYIPDSERAVLNDPGVPLYFTEGEKKCLKAVQEGLHCIGLSGLWNWKAGKGGAIADFDQINFKDREVFIVPDNDYKKPDSHGYKKNLITAVNELAAALAMRGSVVHIIELPQGVYKGLDDYLCQYSLDQFKQLPAVRFLPLEVRIQAAGIGDIESLLSEIGRIKKVGEREAHLSLLAKKFKVPKSELRKNWRADGNDGAENIISASFEDLVDIAEDEDGDVCYLILKNGILLSARDYVIDKQVVVPPDKIHIPFSLPSAAAILNAYKAEDKNLFQDVQSYLRRFSSLTEPQVLICALYVFLSYLQDHPEIYYLPELLFHAVPERGKSRTGKALIYICYRGIHLAELREVNIFRFSENFGATLFLDVMNLWKKAEKSESTDIMLCRYEKGQRCARVLNPDAGAYKDMKYFNIYGPTIIATNEPLSHILDTRCIPIIMENVPGQYENPKPNRGIDLKARLIAWRARMISSELPKVAYDDRIAGRMWDISEPLLQVCMMLQPDQYDALVDALISVSQSRKEDKLMTFDGQIVSIIKDLFDENGTEFGDCNIENKAILPRINSEIPDEKRHKTAHWLGYKLKALGLRRNKKRDGAYIKINADELALLCGQYGVEHTLCENVTNVTNETPKVKSTTSNVTFLTENREIVTNVTETSRKNEKENQTLKVDGGVCDVCDVSAGVQELILDDSWEEDGE